MVPTRGCCPLCGAEGNIGDACEEPPCRVSARHVIPIEAAEAFQALPEIRRDARVGTIVDDFLVIGVIGAGGFGSVYLALQLPILMRVALKLMIEAEETAITPNALRRFENEALSLSRLNHPHIVRLLKYGRLGTRPFIAMEYVANAETLRATLERSEGRLPPGEIRSIVEQLLSALETAHQEHIVHRDLKPENVMIQSVPGYRHFVRVLDFGLAKFFEQTYRTTMNVGTPSYLAPEQLHEGEIGPWTDLYTVGVLIYELATGVLPFGGDNVEQVLRRKLDGAYDPCRSSVSLPDGVRAFLRQAMHRDRRGRFQTAQEFRRAFDAVFESWEQTGQVELARTGEFDAPPGLRAKRRRWIYALFVVALLGLTGTLVALYRAKESRRPNASSQSRDGGEGNRHVSTTSDVRLGPVVRPLPPIPSDPMPSPSPPLAPSPRPSPSPPLAPSPRPAPSPRLAPSVVSKPKPGPADVQGPRQKSPDLLPLKTTMPSNLSRRLLGRWRVITYVSPEPYEAARGGVLHFMADQRWEIRSAANPSQRVTHGRWSVVNGTLRAQETLGTGSKLMYFRVSFEGDRLRISATSPRLMIVASRLGP